MSEFVAVFNAPPIYAAGLAGVLSASGYALEQVTDPKIWLRRHPRGAVLLGVHDTGDLDLVVELKAEDPDSVVVTLVDSVSVSTVHASLRAGAAGSVSLGASASEVVLTLTAALSNNVVIPAPVARFMIRNSDSHQPPEGISPDELSLLRALASGETVVDLGFRLGYSEREMYRRLRRLYSRMGATGRTDALLRAARLGWLDEVGSSR